MIGKSFVFSVQAINREHKISALSDESVFTVPGGNTPTASHHETKNTTQSEPKHDSKAN